MIIYDFDILGTLRGPFETDAPLDIHPDGVPSCTVSL
jgi:hypothetical protein